MAPSSPDQVQIGTQRIPRGYADIAKSLGLEPGRYAAQTSFMTAEERHGIPEPTGDFYLSAMAATMLKTPDSAGVCFQLAQGVREHLTEIGSLQGQCLEIPLPENVRAMGSVDRNILRELQRGNQEMADFLHGKTIMALQPDSDTVEIARLTGGSILTSPDTVVKCNSKEWLRNGAAEGGYTIAPGFSFQSTEALAESIRECLPYLNEKGEIKVWFKFNSLSGGDGVFPIILNRDLIGDPVKLMNRLMQGEPDEVARNCGYYNGSSPETGEQKLNAVFKHMPMIIEVDIGSLPDVEAGINTNVQFIVSDRGVDFVEISSQLTKEGKYLGNEYPINGKAAEYAELAKEQGLKACILAWKEGYRGYVGTDVIVGVMKNGEAKARIIDFNARGNASTPAVSMYHQLTEGGESIVGANINLSLPYEVTTFTHGIKKYIGDLLLDPSKGQRQGIMLTAMRGNADRTRSIDLKNKVLKTTIFAPNTKIRDDIMAGLNARDIKIG